MFPVIQQSIIFHFVLVNFEHRLLLIGRLRLGDKDGMPEVREMNHYLVKFQDLLMLQVSHLSEEVKAAIQDDSTPALVPILK